MEPGEGVVLTVVSDGPEADLVCGLLRSAGLDCAYRDTEAIDSALATAGKDPWSRLEAACAAHLTLLVGSPDVSLVSGTSLFHTAPPALQRRLNRDRDAYEARYTTLIAALRLPPQVDAKLLRLNLLGALNWTRMWYRPGKRHPKALAQHLVQVILRQPLGRAIRVPSPNSA